MNGPSRRSVVRAAVWSAPALSFAAAAPPAAAASGQSRIVFAPGASEMRPGTNGRYRLFFVGALVTVEGGTVLGDDLEMQVTFRTLAAPTTPQNLDVFARGVPSGWQSVYTLNTISPAPYCWFPGAVPQPPNGSPVAIGPGIDPTLPFVGTRSNATTSPGILTLTFTASQDSTGGAVIPAVHTFSVPPPPG